MDGLFKIKPEHTWSAFYHLLTQSLATNLALCEMLLPAYCEQNQIDIKEARAKLDAFVRQKTNDIQGHIHEHFGHIDLTDILGNEENK